MTKTKKNNKIEKWKISKHNPRNLRYAAILKWAPSFKALGHADQKLNKNRSFFRGPISPSKNLPILFEAPHP